MTDRGVDSRVSLVPESCTLPTVDQPFRLAEFDQLVRTDALAVRRVGKAAVAIDLRPDPEVAARAAELATRETACCSFFTFTLAIGDQSMVLEVSTPPEYGTVLDSLAARAQLCVRPSA